MTKPLDPNLEGRKISREEALSRLGDPSTWEKDAEDLARRQAEPYPETGTVEQRRPGEGSSSLIITKDPDFLADQHCCCGADAEIAWHTPVEKEKPKKLSKTEDNAPILPKKPQPYGRACRSHLPGVDRGFLARLKAFLDG